MTECNKVCFDEELVENERYHQGAMGSGDYTYEAKYVGEGRGDLRKIPARSEYRCNTCCQVLLCLAVLGVFVGLLLWLTTAPVFGFQAKDEATAGEPGAFDCNDGFGDWRMRWNDAKKEFCCEKMGRGCGAGHVGHVAHGFDCSGPVAGWGLDRRAKCCDQGRKEACGMAQHRPAAPYNCHAGISNWKHGWSVMKKNFCCQHHHVGCLHAYHPGFHAPHQNHYQIVHHVHHAPPAHHVVSVPVPTPAPVPPAQHMVYHTHVVHVPHSYAPYHCYQGVNGWDKMWSTSKKAYCCTRHSVFCAGAGYTNAASHVHYVSAPETHVQYVPAPASHVHYVEAAPASDVQYVTSGGHYSYGHSYGHAYGHSFGHSGYSTSSLRGYGSSHAPHGLARAKLAAKGIAQCGAGVAHQCPSDWASGAGGFHCMHQLTRQTSHVAYLKSGGACRPASEGPFPVNDCQAQCRIGS